jgi:glycosyltransferase involved in cell wall biosynthesis
MMTVDILMATYNGAPYLAEQIDSLLAQTVSDWRLLIRDDGSTDSTSSIIADYCHRYPGKIECVTDELGNLGYVQNFAQLMVCAQAPYMMFCDQDDVWFPHKIEVSLKKIRQMELLHGIALPLLVFTDLQVCDEQGITVAKSYWQYQHILPRVGLHHAGALLQCNTTGNTFILNQPLKELALPIPELIPGHDWWVALIALYAGEIDYLDQSTLKYRQHAKNASGEKGTQLSTVQGKLLGYCAKVLLRQQQAACLLERLSPLLRVQEKKILCDYAGLSQQGFWRRLSHILRNHYWVALDLRTLGKLFFLLRCRQTVK